MSQNQLKDRINVVAVKTVVSLIKVGLDMG